MAADFFDDLTRKISKTAEDVGKKTTEVVERQRLRNQIYNLERGIRIQYEDLGKIIYDRYEENETVEDSFKEICEEISQKKEMVERYEKEIADLKGQNVCPSCSTFVQKEDLFCKRCGSRLD